MWELFCVFMRMGFQKCSLVAGNAFDCKLLDLFMCCLEVMLLKSGIDSVWKRCVKCIDNTFLPNCFGESCLFVLFQLL